MAELEYEKNELQRQLRETQENLNKNEESQLEMSKELTAGRTDLAQSLRTIDTLRAQLDTFKDETQTVSELDSSPATTYMQGFKKILSKKICHWKWNI